MNCFVDAVKAGMLMVLLISDACLSSMIVNSFFKLPLALGFLLDHSKFFWLYLLSGQQVSLFQSCYSAIWLYHIWQIRSLVSKYLTCIELEEIVMSALCLQWSALRGCTAVCSVLSASVTTRTAALAVNVLKTRVR